MIPHIVTNLLTFAIPTNNLNNIKLSLLSIDNLLPKEAKNEEDLKLLRKTLFVCTRLLEVGNTEVSCACTNLLLRVLQTKSIRKETFDLREVVENHVLTIPLLKEEGMNVLSLIEN